MVESFVTEELSNSVITKFFSNSVGQSTRQRTVCKNCPGGKGFQTFCSAEFLGIQQGFKIFGRCVASSVTYSEIGQQISKTVQSERIDMESETAAMLQISDNFFAIFRKQYSIAKIEEDCCKNDLNFRQKTRFTSGPHAEYLAQKPDVHCYISNCDRFGFYAEIQITFWDSVGFIISNQHFQLSNNELLLLVLTNFQFLIIKKRKSENPVVTTIITISLTVTKKQMQQ